MKRAALALTAASLVLLVACNSAVPSSQLPDAQPSPLAIAINPQAIKSADLMSVFMLSANEGWAVGRLAGDIGCAVVHYLNGVWRSEQIPTMVCSEGTTLSDVRMVAQNEGWAVGYKSESGQRVTPIILHYVNGIWQLVPPPSNVSLSKLAMLSRDEGWAVGLHRDWSNGGKTTSDILHYQNEQWTLANTLSDTDINDIFMISPDEGWAVGSSKTSDEEFDIVLHYSNSRWDLQRLPGARLYLTALDMTSRNEGWAVGLFGARHFHGGDWDSVDVGLGALYKIDMLDANEGWAAVYDQARAGSFAHYSNGVWTGVNTPNNAIVSDIFMVSSTQGWAVGAKGLILHYLNGLWERVDLDEQVHSTSSANSAVATSTMQPELYSTPATASQQIAFAVKDGKFTHLRVEGKNQQGVWTTWETSDSNGLTIALTQNYWWQGTIVLTFDAINLGTRTCVLDYLREASGSSMSAITYTEGQGCSGEGGSAQNATLIAGLAKYTTAEDSYKIVDAAQSALDVRECIKGIVIGLAEGVRGKVMAVVACGGATLYAINGILEKYNVQITDK